MRAGVRKTAMAAVLVGVAGTAACARSAGVTPEPGSSPAPVADGAPSPDGRPGDDAARAQDAEPAQAGTGTAAGSLATAGAPEASAGATSPHRLRGPHTVLDGKDPWAAGDAARDWLVRHQSGDGRWDLSTRSAEGGDARCAEGSDPADVVGETSLALLALLSYGADRRSEAAAKSGVAWLVSAQDADGSFGADTGPHRELDHALATAALCTWRGMERRPSHGGTAERAVARLLALRTPSAAWSEGPPDAPCDLRVTTWATLALVHARTAEIPVPTEAFRDVLAWLDTDPGDRSESAAAMRTCCRVWCGATRRDPHLLADLAILEAADPVDPAGPGVRAGAVIPNAPDRYFVTLAEYLWGGDLWRHRVWTFNPTFLPRQRNAGEAHRPEVEDAARVRRGRRRISTPRAGSAESQHRDDDACLRGSWDPAGAAGAAGPLGGSRLATTALTSMLFDASFISTYRNAVADEPRIPK